MDGINKFLKKTYSLSKNTTELVNSKRRREKLEKNKWVNQKVKWDLDSLTNIFLSRFSDILDLDENNEKIKKEKFLNIFKRKIFSENIIKEENIPESYWKLQLRIITKRWQAGDLPNWELSSDFKKAEFEKIVYEQKESLNQWIDYFSDSTANYHIWLKYWAFRSILGLQSFDKSKSKFTKRNNKTVAHFPELNREALAYVFEFIEKKINWEKLEKPNESVYYKDFEKIIKKESFAELYSFAVKEANKGNIDNLKNIKWKWKKYDKWSDHLELVNDIKWKNTWWCTVWESTAKSQLEKWDFHIYFSEDKNGDNTIPRIAIRMEWNNISEIRGIDDNQNFDPNIWHKLKEKISDFWNEWKKYEKKVDDMELLESIYERFEKIENSSELNLETNELEKLYWVNWKNIEGFGYSKDPRLEKILSIRNRKKDLVRIFNCKEDEISSSKEDVLYWKEIVFFDWNLDLDLLFLEKTPEGFKFPENISGGLYLNSLKEIPEGFKFPENIWGGLYLNSLKEIPEGFKFPENIWYDLILKSLKEIPEGLKFPENIWGDLNLMSLKEIPEGFKFPENVWYRIYLFKLNKKDSEKLKKERPDLINKIVTN